MREWEREFQLNLPEKILNLTRTLENLGFSVVITGRAAKTAQIRYGNLRFGYINAAVISRGLLGYHFRAHGGDDACPKEMFDRVSDFMTSHYGISSNDLREQDGTGSNLGRRHLVFTSSDAAIRVLTHDAGIGFAPAAMDGPNIMTTKFREGQVRDVVMQRRERSPEARSACIDAHGADCVACGINMKRRYSLSNELIHVHHEEPLAESSSEREVDPITDMKPLCPNCHAAIHAIEPMPTVKEFVARLMQ